MKPLQLNRQSVGRHFKWGQVLFSQDFPRVYRAHVVGRHNIHSLVIVGYFYLCRVRFAIVPAKAQSGFFTQFKTRKARHWGF